jgi:signal transduction histidine kinase/DNA-binding response OmpR family regulator
MKSLFQRFIVLGHHEDDTEDEKLRKSSLLLMSAPFALAGVVWGLLYFAKGLNLPGSIPFTYGILSVLSIYHFAKTTKYKIFRSSQLLLILILPFSLQLSLGGFIPSSAVIMWALISPAGALVFFSKKQSLIWFAAFLSLVVIAFLVNSILPQRFDWQQEESFINALFLMNIFGISSIVFMIQYYFVGKQTELKEAIEEKSTALEVQAEKLKEMDEVKSRFFANISHEFRTPLTLILGITKKQLANPDEAPNPEDSDTVKRNAQRLLQLINQLLDLSKLESGEVKLNIEKLDIISFTRTVTAHYESLAEEKNIKQSFNGQILSDILPSNTIIVHFDQERLTKVLNNLISNAIKFTPHEGVIDIEVKNSHNELSQEGVAINISNSGDGIPQDNLDKVFDRFYQVDAATTRAYEGTGIGLSLVKELVELHNGNVQVTSALGITTFSVWLPLEQAGLQAAEFAGKYFSSKIIAENVDNINHQINARPEVDIDKTTTDDTGELEILIVEDNPDLRKFIRDILAANYKVIEAIDGQDGLEKAEEFIPDLIVSDVMMPRMDGYELCKTLKSSNTTNHIPVILLTAKATKENKLEGLEIGADDYLIKPFDEEELKVRIKNLIAIREKLQLKYEQEVWLRPKEVKVSSVHQKFLEELKDAIEKNIDNDQFSVEDLGSVLAMSRSQVHRKLKALTNQSATTFIRNYRLHRAAELLKLDSGNVTEIAYQVGFSSQTYFSKCFQELFSCSPSEYKAKQA